MELPLGHHELGLAQAPVGQKEAEGQGAGGIMSQIL
jgi:hypothetical protein